MPARDILFLSDSREELDAARQAGMLTTALRREAVTGPCGDHPVAEDFDAVQLRQS